MAAALLTHVALSRRTQLLPTTLSSTPRLLNVITACDWPDVDIAAWAG
jgi:hypothetical protein